MIHIAKENMVLELLNNVLGNVGHLKNLLFYKIV